MRVALEKGYALQPDMPHITNGLAYYWAKQKNDLEKAEYYSNKSLAMHPSNPYFLDTKAYILYKQKKYTEAESILKGIEHNSAPIFLHLAQVYYKLDNHKEALMYAQKSASENITVKEREKVNKLQVLCAMTETMNNTYE
jgi:predicted Zn-dependent protease